MYTDEELRMALYNDLISVGYDSGEAWELISQMDLAEYYDD